MGNRRFVARSDSDEEVVDKKSENEKRKKRKIAEEVEEEWESDKNEDMEEDDDEGEAEEEAPKPVGDVIKVSGKGKSRRNHYKAFDYDGNSFKLEDPVLLTPEDTGQKPYVAIIKEITQDKEGSMMVTGQWFYRPEEAEKKGGGNWEKKDTRELFYSFHRDEVPAESVMHKCVVHFVPLHKQLPRRSEHPGFIVQKVYDTVERKLWRLTDKDYEDGKQHEIDLLVQKTRECLGELPNIETEEALADLEYQQKNKRHFRKKLIPPIDVSREDDPMTRTDQLAVETPGSCTGVASDSEYFKILGNNLTGDTVRDKWLEKLLQGIEYVCNSKDCAKDEHKEKCSAASLEKTALWPDAAVTAIVALEQASHDAFSGDFQKYNQKMRQLHYNLKNNERLAKRLVNRELEASVILNMSPNELKDGLTTEEAAPKEPEQSERMQMTDARCARCMEKKVGLTDIIQAGRGDRYQLECLACGNTWYASRDEASELTIEAPNVVTNVGTAPLATAKFEDVEKKLLSPRETEKKLLSPRETEKKLLSPRETEKKLLSPRETEKTS
ncbi:uncharacterized protein LOC113358373 isoform X2 [Papaver somniferum]|uniref:uncharacterized protein LOC113358373 isoform X2 n=1 Tax=Papaver somniferum TaxID=3469 RepID=UPI000E7042AD|nr:uncharacterized protein LOC113358373 isoform X2 [Papaver somniferum]